MMVPEAHCPPPETIAMIAEGKLPRRELVPHMAHIAGCTLCRTGLDLATRTLAEEQERIAPRRIGGRGWWRAAAAAAVAIAILAAVLPAMRSGSPIETLAKLTPRSARVVEPRLTGGFAWAPYTGVARSGDAAADAQRLKLGGAAGSVIEEAARDDSAGAQHAAGIACVLIEKPGEAVERLRAVAGKSPRDAAVWSDLAAAQFAAALQLERPSLLPQALASADRAVAIDAGHAEGLFNRALILERLGLAAQARAAWQRYLEIDAGSPWAQEARTHLSALPAASSDAQFRRELPRLERAAAAGELAAIDPIVGRWREQSRAWGEAEFLGRWGEAAQRGDAAEAARLLSIARSLGAVLRTQSGESLLADAGAAIASAGDASRAVLAEGHATYRRGRIAYSRQMPAAADADLRRAASLFERGGSPMARMALYYAANTRFDQNDPAGARAELGPLLATAPADHIAASALIRWELSLCHNFDGDAGGALPHLIASAAALRRLDERNNLGFVEGMLADTYSALGRPDDAWAARIRSFEALSRDGRADRLLINLTSAVAAERRVGNRAVALSLLAVERDAGRELDDAVNRSRTLARMAVLRAELGDLAGARELVGEVSAIVPGITDPGLRALAEANVQLARGAVLLPDQPASAMSSLAEALRAYGEMGQPALEIDCRLLRVRAAQALGRPDDAGREIDAGLKTMERFRVALAGGGNARGVLDAGDELFEHAIRLSLDRGDKAKAFEYAERARVRLADAETTAGNVAGAIQARLAGSGAALVELTVLPEESIAFHLDATGLDVARTRIAREELLALAQRSRRGDRAAAGALYDLFLRPWASNGAQTLIIVPDPLLDAVPFAALYDARAGRHLIERVRVLRAESAASLRVAPPRAAPASVVSVALPSGSRTGSAALSENGIEVSEIAAAYGRGVQLSSDRSTFAEFVAAARMADVVHLSGHTRDDGDGGSAALDFAGSAGAAPQRVQWRAVAGARLSGVPLVVLAACDSLRLPRLTGSRAPSLGGAFLAAGAAEVIGTIRPIGDRDARELFRAIHRRLASGAAPADAVRDVQIQAIAAGRTDAWSSIAVLTREIPGGTKRRSP